MAHVYVTRIVHPSKHACKELPEAPYEALTSCIFLQCAHLQQQPCVPSAKRTPIQHAICTPQSKYNTAADMHMGVGGSFVHRAIPSDTRQSFAGLINSARAPTK